MLKISATQLAGFVGLAGFYLINKKEIEITKKTSHAKDSSLTKQMGKKSNQTNKEFVTTSRGLQYRILNAGSGDTSPEPKSVVTVHYLGKLTNGLELQFFTITFYRLF